MRTKRTPAQRATSRENGKKGKGPKTESGKDRSKMNALKHGFTCEFLLLPGESHVEFEHLKRQYLQRFQPRDAVEYTLVEQLIQCDWELHRAWNDQRLSTYVRIDEQRKSVDSQYVDPSPEFRIALARKAEFTEDGAYAQILERHITRISQRMTRTLRALHNLRHQFPLAPESPSLPASHPPEPAPAQKMQNEPEPASTSAKSVTYKPAVIPFPHLPETPQPAPEPESANPPRTREPGDPPCA